MTYREAIEILTEFNSWRRGDIDDIRYTPKEIGQAIEIAIEGLTVLNSEI
jgi:hypothetical protein